MLMPERQGSSLFSEEYVPAAATTMAPSEPWELGGAMGGALGGALGGARADPDLRKEVDELRRQVAMLRMSSGSGSQPGPDQANFRMEDVMMAIQEESRYRSEAMAGLNGAMDELRQQMKQEMRERGEADDGHYKQSMGLEAGMQQFMNQMNKEISMIKQDAADLRASSTVESSMREEGLARMQAVLDDEVRAREESSAKESSLREAVEARLEQKFSSSHGELRQVREINEGSMDQKIAALQHEFNFEKAKSAAQARELGQALQQAREALNAESASRRQENALLVKALEEAREGQQELGSNADKGHGRAQEQISMLDKWLVDLRNSVEASNRQAMQERLELQDGVQRLARVQTELENAMMNGLSEERRMREDMVMGEQKVRDEGDQSLMNKVTQMLQEEADTRKEAILAISQRVASESTTRDLNFGEHEEQWRVNAANISKLQDALSEAKAELRKVSQRCEDFDALREALLQESTRSQNQERALEMAVKENQVKLEQLSTAREQAERRFDQRVTEIVEKVEGENKVRARGLGDMDSKMAEFANEHLNAQKASKRELEDLVNKAEKAFQEKHAEEQRKREAAVGQLQQKTLELREGVDESRKWRSEQYNELILEVAKLTEMITEETKSRQQQDQVLASEVTRLREEGAAEVDGRKIAVGNVVAEMKDLLSRMERDRDNHLAKEKERFKGIETLNEQLITEGARRDAAITELRGLIDREAATREEVVQGATRALQRANAKINEEWRAACRNETIAREEGQLRLEQQCVELRTAVQENSSINEQQTEEIRTRFKTCQEQLSMEEFGRKTEDVLIQKAVEDLKALIASEQTDRGTGEQHVADRFVLLENQLRDEALLREDSERRTTKELLDLTGRLQAEQVAREESDGQLQQRINVEAAKHEDNHATVCKQRELSDASTADAWQRGLRELQMMCERDRKEAVNRLQQVQQQQQQEHDDRLKADRELTQAVARLQSLGKEEEESRIEQGERLGAAIESIHDAVRVLGPQREEILKKAMEANDMVRNLLNREVVARTERANVVDENLRELSRRIAEEEMTRGAAVKSCEEALMEERNMREDQLVRERRTTEEEIQRAISALRKQREDETRKLQERLLEVSSAITEERDMRAEAIRQERAKMVDIKEQIARDQKNIERETVKVSQQMIKQLEGEMNRAKEVEMALTGLNEKCDAVRNDFSNEVQKRTVLLQGLENRLMETHAVMMNESNKQTAMNEDLKKTLEEEIGNREAIISTDRRAREAGDLQVANTLKNALRDDREARDKELGKVAQEIAALKTALVEEAGRREDDKAGHNLNVQKIRTDFNEMMGERKVDNVAMREAFVQVTEELKVVQRSRKDDVDRLDTVLANMSARVDANARAARDQSVALEENLNVVGAEVRQIAEEYNAGAQRLETRILEEKRTLEQNSASDKRALEVLMSQTDQAIRQHYMEEQAKSKALMEKVGAKVGNLESDLEKSRASAGEQARELARGIAALQGVASAEEQARQQSAWQLQQGLDALREEVVKEGKERALVHAKTQEDFHNVQRSIASLDERNALALQKHGADVGELKDRHARETRQREASISQVEQRLLSFQGVRDGTPTSAAIRMATRSLDAPADNAAGAPAPNKEILDRFGQFQRDAEEEIARQKRQIQDIITDAGMMGKNLASVSDRVDTLRNGLNATEARVTEVQMKQRMMSDVEQAVRRIGEDVTKEITERRADSERLARVQAQAIERMDATEQKRMAVEGELKQKLLDTDTALKKKDREHDQKIAAFTQALREEVQKREEGFEREARMRTEHHERGAEALRGQMREERRQREKEVMRLEGNSLALQNAAGKPGGIGERSLGGGGDVANLTIECRSLRQGLGEVQDRLQQTEARQKSAEERTVSMLDAIMSGLTQPGE